MTKDRDRGETRRSVTGLGVGATILQAQRTGKNKGYHLRPAGRWARTWWMLEVAAALGGEAGQEGGACWMGFTLEARPRACTAPEGHKQPVRVSPDHDSPLGCRSDRLEARKEAAGE